MSWLIGVWEGTGVIDYQIDAEPGAEPTHPTAELGHRVSFSHDGLPYLNYSSTSWLLPDGGDNGAEPIAPVAHVAESGYWRLHRPATDGDPGPGMLMGSGERAFTTADEVEQLRNAD